ncbi:unnamed protein product [Arabidopsis halleri]
MAMKNMEGLANKVNRMVNLVVGRGHRVGATIPSNGRTRREQISDDPHDECIIATFFSRNMWKSVFDSLVLVFVEHPFDVGDRCETGEIEMVVEDIEILRTIDTRTWICGRRQCVTMSEANAQLGERYT